MKDSEILEERKAAYHDSRQLSFIVRVRLSEEGPVVTHLLPSMEDVYKFTFQQPSSSDQ